MQFLCRNSQPYGDPQKSWQMSEGAKGKQKQKQNILTAFYPIYENSFES